MSGTDSISGYARLSRPKKGLLMQPCSFVSLFGSGLWFPPSLLWFTPSKSNLNPAQSNLNPTSTGQEMA
jgi:hypothetical protein